MAVDNVIQYITIASTGNATDFGNLSAARYSNGSLASTTRAVFCGGWNSSNAVQDIMEYVTIASTGNVTDFGNLLSAASSISDSCTSNNTRGIIAGGGDSESNVIQYITIASTGNATDFGDLSEVKKYVSATAGGDRGVFGGGNHDDGTFRNTMEYIDITSTGNVTDFGDLTVARARAVSMSNSHGGL